MSLTVAACFTACSDSSSDSSYEIPSYKNEAALPDSCNMEIAKVDTAYYACFENKWVAVTDSATVEQFKEGLDEKEIKAKLEELEKLLIKNSSSSEKLASSSSAAEKVDDNSAADNDDSSDGSDSSDSGKDDVEESSSSSEETSSSSEEEVVDCSGKTAKVGDKQNMSVTVDGKQRTFIMHIPSAYKGDKPVPLVIDYHQIGGSGNGEFGSSPYKAKTDPEGVITLYPDGTSKPGGMGNGWNVGPCCSNDDDVKFSYAMIDKLKEIACIDPQRIYATGFSMGGGMTNHVACFMSDVFAAVAPAGMDLNKTNSAQCNPTRPISIIMFRGTNDPVCKYQGGDSGFNDGLNFLGAEGNFKFWAQKNGCTGSPSKNSDGCDEYSNCKDGTKVVLCTKQGGGHDYGDASIGWPFLKQFTLP